MSTFKDLVEFLEHRGYTGKDAIAEAKEIQAKERELELERIKLEQMKISG